MIGNLFPEVYKKHFAVTSLFIGWIYALIGIIVARILFPTDPSIAGIAFTSLLILSDEVFSKKLFEIRNKPLKKVFVPYAALFVGVFLIYIVISIILPSIQTNDIFRTQLSITENTPNLQEMDLLYFIFFNNLIIVLIIFWFSAMMRGGGVFFLVWNASVWGAIFGMQAKNIALTTSLSPFLASTGFLLFVCIIGLPFIALEVLAYINAAVAGNKVNEFIRLKRIPVNRIFKDAIVVVIVSMIIILFSAYIEASIINNINPSSYFR